MLQPEVEVPQSRSRNMAAIKGRNTKPELLVRHHLHAAGFRYRLNVRDLPGCPDIVLPKYRTVIFVHGCFWHRHKCQSFKWPKTRAAFWKDKIEQNVGRDHLRQLELRALGWRVLIIWECKLKKGKFGALRPLFLLRADL